MAAKYPFRMRRPLIIMLISGLLVSQFPAVANEDDAFNVNNYFDRIFVSREYQAPVTYVVTGIANTFTTATASLIAKQPPAASGSEARNAWGFCSSTTDPNCEFSKASYNGQYPFGIIANTVLPVCTTKEQEDCVESFEIAYGDEKFSPANYLRTLNSSIEIKRDSDLNFPGGSRVSLWNDATINKSKSKSYMVNVAYALSYFPDQRKFEIVDIGFEIQPYREIYGNYRAPYYDEQRKEYVNTISMSKREVWTEDGRAGVLVNFPNDGKYRLKVRIANKLAGWYQGRIKDPTIDIEPLSGTNNLVTIEGQAVKVPTFAHTTEYSKLSRLQTQWHSRGTGQVTNGFLSAMNSDWKDIFDYIDYFRPLTGDKTAGTYTLWNVTSTKWVSNNSCLTDTSRLIGIVSTNAMGYDGNAPQYSNGTINYKVAGMHYEPDGKSLVEGTYDLLMRSDAARCLYGFSNAPVQATISVTGDNEQKVAVTSMTEGNGWIKLSAYGFNFSSPTIRVQLSQVQSEPQKIEAPKVESQPAPAPSAVAMTETQIVIPKKKSITCIKGKVTKKVSGTNPKCPTGYKKK